MQGQAAHILIALLLLAVLVFLSVTGSLTALLDIGRKGSEILSKPFTAVFLPLRNLAGVVTSIKDLSKENESLVFQLVKLQAELAVLERFKQENQELREALGFSLRSAFDLIPAEVITLDPLSQNQKVILNRGRAQGVRQGAAVVVADKVLVGIIASVLEHTSEMELITSSEITLNAQSSSGEATGVIRGEHGLGLLFDLISQNEVINIRDRLVTSGLGGQLPRNLLIGVISEIRSSQSDLFQQATVIPAVNLKTLDVVFVLKQ